MLRHSPISIISDTVEPGDLAMLQRVFRACLKFLAPEKSVDDLAQVVVLAYLEGERDEVGLIVSSVAATGRRKPVLTIH